MRRDTSIDSSLGELGLSHNWTVPLPRRHRPDRYLSLFADGDKRGCLVLQSDGGGVKLFRPVGMEELARMLDRKRNPVEASVPPTVAIVASMNTPLNGS